jgi:hypothetical protein
VPNAEVWHIVGEYPEVADRPNLSSATSLADSSLRMVCKRRRTDTQTYSLRLLARRELLDTDSAALFMRTDHIQQTLLGPQRGESTRYILGVSRFRHLLTLFRSKSQSVNRVLGAQYVTGDVIGIPSGGASYTARRTRIGGSSATQLEHRLRRSLSRHPELPVHTTSYGFHHFPARKLAVTNCQSNLN